MAFATWVMSRVCLWTEDELLAKHKTHYGTDKIQKEDTQILML